MRLPPRLRLLTMGLSTVLGLGRRGFFIPYRYADEVPDRPPVNVALEAHFQRLEPVFAAVLRAIEDHAAELEAIGADETASPPPEPRWGQGWFARLDAAAAYALVRVRAPGRIVEVGSGHSTRFLARAIRDAGLQTEVTCIDPEPRADIASLGVHHIAEVVQDVGLDPFIALGEGDVLFIDSSHLAVAGSDVDFLVNHVFPILPDGILVHVHDIFLPDPYPEAWRWRGYAEQLLISALIVSGGFKPVFSSHYARTRMKDALEAGVIGRLPILPGTPETSLWLEKTARPLARPAADAATDTAAETEGETADA